METKGKEMICLVTLPDSFTLAVDVDKNSDGRFVLMKALEKLSICESDYFGLQYSNSRGEEQWLNLRNRLTDELPGSSPYKLSLLVKFFVERHSVLQETTRDVFFWAARKRFVSGKLQIEFEEKVVHLAALLAAVSCDWSVGFVAGCLPVVFRREECIRAVVQQQMNYRNVSKDEAKVEFMQEIQIFLIADGHCHKIVDNARCTTLAVVPDGIFQFSQYSEYLSKNNLIPWCSIQKATHSGLDVMLHLLQDDGNVTTRPLRLTSKIAANSLYRDMTEVYSFYKCDTVGEIVSEQYYRDFKGTIVSLFNEKTDLGKKYVFDIERTKTEAYDRIRRMLYALEQVHCDKEQEKPADEGLSNRLTCDNECQAVKLLMKLSESFLCRVCADNDVNTVFVPCGHIVCCQTCSGQMECCPVCKCHVQTTQTVFLPYTKPVFEINLSCQTTISCA